MIKLKNKFIFFLCGAALSFILLILGDLTILDFSNLDLANWTQDLLESKTGKIACMIVSMSCFFICVILAANVYRKDKEVYMLRLDENKVVMMSNLRKPQKAHSTQLADSPLKEDVAH